MKLNHALPALDDIAGWLDRKSTLFATTATLLVLTTALIYAVKKSFWFDEILTVSVLDSSKRIGLQRTLAGAFDAMPPFFYLLLDPIRTAVPKLELALRLPAVLGITGAMVCLYVLIRPVCGPAAALLALLALPCTDAVNYASEARPYGALVGLCAAAALSWHKSMASLAAKVCYLLTLSFITAIHYYGFLAAVAFLIADLYRCRLRRRLLHTVWSAPFSVAIPLLLQWNYLAAARINVTPHFWSRPNFYTLRDSLLAQFNDLWVLIPLLPAVLLLELLPVGGAGSCNPWYLRAGSENLKPHGSRQMRETQKELAFLGVCLFLLYPLSVYLTAVVFGGGFTRRYVLPASIGIAVLCALFVSRLRRLYRVCILIALFAMLLKSAAAGAGRFFSTETIQRDRSSIEWIRTLSRTSLGGRQPIVVAHGLSFLEAWYSLGSASGSIIYAADPGAAARIVGADSIDIALDRLRRLAPVPVVTYDELRSKIHRFLLVDNGQPFVWLPARLAQDACELELILVAGPQKAYRAVCPTTAAESRQKDRNSIPPE